MSHPIDVGSVLGGRYKVTATVLTSHDQDLVLDGVDQVLNRPVSILVAGPDNTEQVAQSAREVATGERPGNVQILDLGVSEATTYLITNHTSAADLLDLVVASHPPYVEPFFTDTLGSEIFGQARSHEPETYDDDEEVDAGFINYGDNHQSQVNPHPAASREPAAAAHPARPDAGQPSAPPARKAPVVPPRPPAGPASAPFAAGAGALSDGAGDAATGAVPWSSPHSTAPQPVQRENVEQALLRRGDNKPGVVQSAAPSGHGGTGAEPPKVSLWSDEDYGHTEDDQQDQYVAAPGHADASSDRPAGNFPVFARSAAAPATEDYYDEDEPEKEPRSMRWLVGGLLAAVLIAGLVFAVSNLGSLFKAGPQAAPSTGTTTTSPPTTGTPSQSQNSAPAAAQPSIEGVSRLGNFDFAATYDADLTKAFDGNAASYWSDMEFATEDWGGLAGDGVPLVVKLKSPSKVSSISLSQLGASGGSISVFTNDRPSLDGAKQAGTNSFTSTDLTMPLAEPVTAQYVIVSIKTLPKLTAPKTRFGYGLRLAEIKIQ